MWQAAIAIDQWSEETDLSWDDGVMIVLDRADWPELVSAANRESFSSADPDSWESMSPALQYALAVEMLRASGRDIVASLAENSSNLDAVDLVVACSEQLRLKPVLDGARWWLRPRVLLLGERSLFGGLDALVLELSEAAEPGAAWARYQSSIRSDLSASVDAAVQLMLDPTQNPYDRVRVARRLHSWLTFVGAPPDAFTDYWAARTEMERALCRAGHRSREFAVRCAGEWIACAGQTADEVKLAEALAKRAVLRTEMGASFTVDDYASSIADLRESMRLQPADPEIEKDQVRVGNLVNALASKMRLEKKPDYAEVLALLDTLIAHQRDGVNRVYSLDRRGAFRLNAALSDPPHASLSEAIQDLEQAIALAGKLENARDVEMSALRNLAAAMVTLADRTPTSDRDAVLAKGLAAVDQLFSLDPEDAMRSMAHEAAADLHAKRGDSDAAERSLGSALALSSPAESERRRALSMRLGALFSNSKRWPHAASAFAAAYGEPYTAPSLSDLQTLGRADEVLSWKPDRAGRWASYAYAKSGDGALAIEFLESALARDFAKVARLEAADLEALQMLHPNIARELEAARSRGWLDSGPAGVVSAAIDASAPSLDRVSIGWISERATPTRPIVYLNPHPSGIVTLILRGSNRIEILSTETVTSADLAAWTISDRSLIENSDPPDGLIFQHELSGVSSVLRRALPKIGENLIGPLARSLRASHATEILLITCGFAPFLPLHAAPYSSPDGAAECLADWIDVVVGPCVSLAARRLSRPLGLSSHYVGIADPMVPDLPPLPGAATEVVTGARWIAPENRYVGIGQDATLDAIQRNAQDGCVLHLAVHTRHGSTGLGFALSDGDLPILELSDRIGVTPRLIFAASCSSGRPHLDDDVDQSRQVGTVMIAAGCPVVVAALWPVDDTATNLLVSKFYELHISKGLPPQTSLRLASGWLKSLTHRQILMEVDRIDSDARGWLKVLRTRASERLANLLHPYSDPAYWAPFMVYGARSTGA